MSLTFTTPLLFILLLIPTLNLSIVRLQNKEVNKFSLYTLTLRQLVMMHIVMSYGIFMLVTFLFSIFRHNNVYH